MCRTLTGCGCIMLAHELELNAICQRMDVRFVPLCEDLGEGTEFVLLEIALQPPVRHVDSSRFMLADSFESTFSSPGSLMSAMCKLRAYAAWVPTGSPWIFGAHSRIRTRGERVGRTQPTAEDGTDPVAKLAAVCVAQACMSTRFKFAPPERVPSA